MEAGETAARRRTFVLFLVVLLATPTIASGLAALDGEERSERRATENVTFVSLQGGFGLAADGRVVAIDTDSGETVWEFTRGVGEANVFYYDVDPLSVEELLLVEHAQGQEGSVLHVDWRRDEILAEFDVPPDTHDVDYLGDGRYVVADKFDHRAFVYDRGSDSVVWEYEFAEHYPEYPDAGEAPSTRRSGVGGYTHLNDVDAVDGGSAFLLNPRNFDRVVLVDRSTKETTFVLGAEDDYSVLREQHNPVLLSMEPPTVLVADSENDRVVEYRRRADGSWDLVWGYRGDLHWPRDADRLPNGNTLVVDSYGRRVVEVTPEKEVVWGWRTEGIPYDVERLRYGDEPRGPPTGAESAETEATAAEVGLARELYVRALWILPAWIGLPAFYSMLAAVAVATVWLVAELQIARV